MNTDQNCRSNIMWAEVALIVMGFLTTVGSQKCLKSLSSHNIYRTNEIKLFVTYDIRGQVACDIGNIHRGMPGVAPHADEVHYPLVRLERPMSNTMLAVVLGTF